MCNSTDTTITKDLFAEAVLCFLSCCGSIFGAVCIFLTFVTIPDIRNFTTKLIVCLTVADTLTASGYILTATEILADSDWGVCVPQSYVTTYSSLVSFFLTVFISFHIWASVGNNQSFSTATFLGFNIIGWVVPVIILIPAGYQGVLGKDNKTQATGPWCWIKQDVNKRVEWMFLTGKGWELLCYLTTISFYILLKYQMFQHIRDPTTPTLRHMLQGNGRNFVYIWLVLYILRFPGTLKFFLTTFCTADWCVNRAPKPLTFMQAVGDPAQAFCNFLLFCVLDSTIRSKIVDRLASAQCLQMCCGYKNQSERRPLLQTSSGSDTDPVSCEDQPSIRRKQQQQQ